MYRDLLPHLETHFEVFGNLVQIVPKLIGCRRTIEGRVIPDRAKAGFTVVEILAVFTQAFSCKGGLGVLLQIDLALPSFVGPG